MPHSPHRDGVDIVLVRPRNPLNIGAAARAMANFGFAHLTVVAPYAPHWQEAKSAIGAAELLQNARSAEGLAEAVADCTLVAGTGSLAHRRPEQRAIPLPELAPIVDAEMKRGGRAALVFGPEKHGLTRDDLSLCHLLVEIPTDSRQPSMNLGQAVAVCLYELAVRRREIASPHSQPGAAADRPVLAGASAAPAPSGALGLLAGVIEETMAASGYSPAIMRNANRLDLRALLRRLSLSEQDARRALRLFRRILWRLSRAGNAVPNDQRSHESSISGG